MATASLSERQQRERGLTGLAELARLDLRSGTVDAVAGRALDQAIVLLGVDRAGVCVFSGDETIEWLAQRRLERLVAASAHLRPSQLSWVTGPLKTGRPEIFDRRQPGHKRSALSDAGDAMGVGAFAIVPIRTGADQSGVIGLAWSSDPPALAHDEELLTTIGRLVGLALGNVRLRDELVTRQGQLDESEARYRGLFEQAPQALLVADWDGRILDANGAAQAMFDATRRRLLAGSIEKLTAVTRDERRKLFGVLHRSRSANAQTRGVRPDGATFALELHLAVSAFRGEERVLLQLRELTAADRSASEAGAGDLDSSLSAIVAFGQMLAADKRLPADVRRESELMLEEAQRARRAAGALADPAPPIDVAEPLGTEAVD